jgi:signal transduction histidine kinase
MPQFISKFRRKLHVAFAMLLMITLGLAWYFNDSVRWYQYDVQRIVMANNVLQGYQEVSNLTLQELNALGSSVLRGDSSELADGPSRAANLREAISRVRQGIAAEVAIDQNAAEAEELESLVEIERVVEEIIRSSALISQALADGRRLDASNELSRLRGSGITGHFSSLIIAALEEQKREARAADQDAIELTLHITNLLPIFMTVVVIITLLVIFLISRSLTRSVSALHDGAQAFRSGNLEHRIPKLREREFSRLGVAFNTMARELSDHRRRLHDANIKLEATVNKRTHALKTSNRKLADVDVNRRQLLADISHEFRTPLTVIRGESEIALRDSKNTVADYRASFQRIMDQADHTTHLVDDLLLIARADAGEPRFKLRSAIIANTVESVCNDFGARAKQKNIKIEQIFEDAKSVVLGDTGRLRQVFTILMDNALRYSIQGGSVEVRLSRTDSDVRISFRDHGIGLTEEESELAFERFYRGHQAEEHARGTGLGLPVAKAIVEAHKGHISLQGRPGEGATATVILPAESGLRVVA